MSIGVLPVDVFGEVMSTLPAHIADWVDMDPLGQWNDTEGSDGWMDADSHLCSGNTSDSSSAAAGHAVTSNNVYVRQRILVNVFIVVGLCAFGFVGNALTIAVLRRDKVRIAYHYYLCVLVIFVISSDSLFAAWITLRTSSTAAVITRY